MKKPTKCDKRLRAVSAALENVEAPGDYCTMGSYPLYPPPGLVVDGVGDIALPLTDAAATELIAASHLAPFGHGEETLVDTEVRNTWEISVNQFRLENAAFTTFIKGQVAEACRVPLGIHESEVFEAKLYKLLLYEAGGKFERHQDSEKEDGMFGTLVVVLPGRFEGGELLVHHPSKSSEAGDVHVFDPAAMDAFSLKYAAFYGDCPHEVKPVTSGFRLCVTFNLVKVASPGAVALPQYGRNHALFAILKNALDKYFCEEGVEKTKRRRIDENGSSAAVGFDIRNPATHRLTKLVYVLTHKYTHANLSFSNLKNRDAAVAASLAQFCGASDGALGLYLCKMEYRFSWSGEPGTMYYSDEESDGPRDVNSEHSAAKEAEVPGGKKTEAHGEQDCEESGGKETDDSSDKDPDGDEKDGSDEDDDDEDDDGDDDEQSGEIERELNLLRPWIQYKERDQVTVDASRKLKTFDKGDLTGEVAPCDVFMRKGIKYDGQSSSEYTGNEGASSERWYGSAALVVAPLQVASSWSLATPDPSAWLETWIQLADSEPAHALAIARAFDPYVFKWSMSSDLGKRILATVGKIDDDKAVCAVLGAIERVEFEPELRRIVTSFDSNSLAKIAETLVAQWRRKSQFGARNCVNFVASILDGVTDTATISAVLDSTSPVPYIVPTESEHAVFGDKETPPEEFVRVLKLAALVSADQVQAILTKSLPKPLVYVAVPALQLLFGASQAQPHDGALAIAIAICAIELLKKSLPTIRNESYDCTIRCATINDYYGRMLLSQPKCSRCDALREFLKSPDEEAVVDKKSFDSHLKEKLQQAGVLDRFTVEPSGDSDVLLKKIYVSQFLKTAEQEIASLEEMVAEFVRVAIVSGVTNVQ